MRRVHYRATGTRLWTCANPVACVRSVSAVDWAHVCRSPRSMFAPEKQTVWIMPRESETAINIVFTHNFCHHSFCGLGDPWPIHFPLCRLVVGWYAKHHDLCPITIVVKNARLWRCAARRSLYEATQSALCSTVNVCGTKWAQIFFTQVFGNDVMYRFSNNVQLFF